MLLYKETSYKGGCFIGLFHPSNKNLLIEKCYTSEWHRSPIQKWELAMFICHTAVLEFIHTATGITTGIANYYTTYHTAL